jgi:hypothetical protein
MLQFVFIVSNWIQNFPFFFAVTQFNRGQSFILCLGTFLGSNVPICLSNKPQTKYFPHGCHEAKGFWPTTHSL